jgi:hypothetical protein
MVKKFFNRSDIIGKNQCGLLLRRSYNYEFGLVDRI